MSDQRENERFSAQEDAASAGEKTVFDAIYERQVDDGARDGPVANESARGRADDMSDDVIPSRSRRNREEDYPAEYHDAEGYHEKSYQQRPTGERPRRPYYDNNRRDDRRNNYVDNYRPKGQQFDQRKPSRFGYDDNRQRDMDRGVPNRGFSSYDKRRPSDFDNAEPMPRDSRSYGAGYDERVYREKDAGNNPRRYRDDEVTSYRDRRSRSPGKFYSTEFQSDKAFGSKRFSNRYQKDSGDYDHRQFSPPFQGNKREFPAKIDSERRFYHDKRSGSPFQSREYPPRQNMRDADLQGGYGKRYPPRQRSASPPASYRQQDDGRRRTSYHQNGYEDRPMRDFKPRSYPDEMPPRDSYFPRQQSPSLGPALSPRGLRRPRSPRRSPSPTFRAPKRGADEYGMRGAPPVNRERRFSDYKGKLNRDKETGCFVCGSFDHMARRCSRFGSTCNVCKMVGHVQSNCPDNNDIKRCSICADPTHMESACRHGNPTCFVCHEKGHIDRACPKTDNLQKLDERVHSQERREELLARSKESKSFRGEPRDYFESRQLPLDSRASRSDDQGYAVDGNNDMHPDDA